MLEFLKMMMLGQEPLPTPQSDRTEIAGRSFTINYDLYAKILKARSNNHTELIMMRTKQLLTHNAHTEQNSFIFDK